MTDLAIFRTVADLRSALQGWRSKGDRIALVPTMGFLHQGHLSLIHLARQYAERVIVSIFVNPTQFGPTEDLSRYPRDPEGDRAKCLSAGADATFEPPPEEIYLPDAQTWVEVSELTRPLCGSSRPTHFRGVTTVVAKLFLIVGPDVAVFGEKDFQQLRTLQQMTRDLFFPIQIVPGPLVREPDGLAMSSRNAYLSPEERSSALCLSQALRLARSLFAQGQTSPHDLLRAVKDLLLSTPFVELDYIEFRSPRDLLLVETSLAPDDRLFLAVKIGRTRLIDNAPLSGPSTLDASKRAEIQWRRS